MIVATQVFITRAGCSEDLRAYDLATGAAYVHRCLPTDGAPARTHVGRVPVGALREAAWMTMLSGAADAGIRPDVAWFDLPTGMRPARRLGEQVRSFRVVVSSSDSSRRVWTWMRRGGSALLGEASGLLEIDGDRAAERYAGELLDVMEAAFTPGCAPVPQPRGVPWSKPGLQVGPASALFFPLDDARLAGARAAIAVANPAQATRCSPLF